MTDKEHFSIKSKSYQTIRPEYPEELFEWLSKITNKNIAIDMCTGNGQVCKGLYKYYETVYGIDINKEQLDNGFQSKNIEYFCGTLDKFIKEKDIISNSIDLITIAQALHFLDIDDFFIKANKILKPNGIIFCCVYIFPTCENNEITNLINYCYYDLLNEYWEDFRKIANLKYKNINFPFEEISVPNECKFIDIYWSKAQLIEFMNTWTAISKAIKLTGKNPLDKVLFQLDKIWLCESYKFTFELHFRCGKKTLKI